MLFAIFAATFPHYSQKDYTSKCVSFAVSIGHTAIDNTELERIIVVCLNVCVNFCRVNGPQRRNTEQPKKRKNRCFIKLTDIIKLEGE